MGVGDATTLTFTAPVITGFLGIFMLKEKWGKVNAIASILCFVGVLFTVKPTWLFPDVVLHLSLHSRIHSIAKSSKSLGCYHCLRWIDRCCISLYVRAKSRSQRFRICVNQLCFVVHLVD